MLILNLVTISLYFQQLSIFSCIDELGENCKQSFWCNEGADRKKLQPRNNLIFSLTISMPVQVVYNQGSIKSSKSRG